MINAPFRGQVWIVNLDPTKGHEQAGTRPCLVVSVNKFNHGRAELVIVVPITRSDKRIASHVPLAAGEGGLNEAGFIKCEEVRCVSKTRLVDVRNTISPETMAEVDKWLRIILGL
jgi:mRNA interferase MazF